MPQNHETLSARLAAGESSSQSLTGHSREVEVYGTECGVLLDRDSEEFSSYAINNPDLPYGFYDEDIGLCLASDVESEKKRLLGYVQQGVDKTYAILSRQGTVSEEDRAYKAISETGYGTGGKLSFAYFKNPEQIVWSACKIDGVIHESFLEKEIVRAKVPRFDDVVSYYSFHADTDIENAFVRSHAYELVDCYERHAPLTAFDAWTRYEELLQEEMSYSEYEYIDTLVEGSPFELTEKADSLLLKGLREELRNSRIDKMSSFVLEQIHTMQEDQDIIRTQTDTACKNIRSIT